MVPLRVVAEVRAACRVAAVALGNQIPVLPASRPPLPDLFSPEPRGLQGRDRCLAHQVWNQLPHGGCLKGPGVDVELIRFLPLSRIKVLFLKLQHNSKALIAPESSLS